MVDQARTCRRRGAPAVFTLRCCVGCVFRVLSYAAVCMCACLVCALWIMLPVCYAVLFYAVLLFCVCVTVCMRGVNVSGWMCVCTCTGTYACCVRVDFAFSCARNFRGHTSTHKKCALRSAVCESLQRDRPGGLTSPVLNACGSARAGYSTCF